VRQAGFQVAEGHPGTGKHCPYHASLATAATRGSAPGPRSLPGGWRLGVRRTSAFSLAYRPPG